MGLPATSVGITEDTFVAFNGMLDVLLDAGAGAPNGGTGGPARKEAAPSSLVNDQTSSTGSLNQPFAFGVEVGPPVTWGAV
jgi:hypothetical protein